jgi:antitoxin (DNA-binding transcriptional repressor) of toxin-antitoxin stability system
MDDAETRLNELAELAWHGQEVIIAKDGKPYLTLTPYIESSGRRDHQRQLGRLAGKIWIAPDFTETPQRVVDSFENGPMFPKED